MSEHSTAGRGHPALGLLFSPLAAVAFTVDRGLGGLGIALGLVAGGTTTTLLVRDQRRHHPRSKLVNGLWVGGFLMTVCALPLPPLAFGYLGGFMCGAAVVGLFTKQ